MTIERALEITGQTLTVYRAGGSGYPYDNADLIILAAEAIERGDPCQGCGGPLPPKTAYYCDSCIAESYRTGTNVWD